MEELKACDIALLEKRLKNLSDGLREMDGDIMVNKAMLTACRDYMAELLALRRAAPENAPEVVKKLWALYDKYEDAEHAVCGDAAKLLQSSPENKPLTLEELRQMDGAPVWVKNNAHPEYSEWKICNGAGESHYYFSNGAAYELNHYGKTWLAYARRQESAKEGSNPHA